MKKISILFLLLVVTTTGLFAQSSLLFAVETPTETDVMVAFYENGQSHYKAPSMPQFYLVGNNDSYYLGVSGYVKGTISYDWGNPINNGLMFTTSSIPTAMAAGNSHLLQFASGSSNIAFNFLAMPNTDNQIGAYINVNFDGNGYATSLQDAYLKYRGFKVGYTTSLFTDTKAAPTTIDYEGPNSWTFVSNTLINYYCKWDNNWEAAIGVEMPMPSVTTNGEAYLVNQYLPDVPLYLQYSWGRKGVSRVRLSALMRTLSYYNEVNEESKSYVGWGVKLSGNAALGSRFTAFYQALMGEGISSYIQDMTGLGLDMLPDSNIDGKLQGVEAWGGYVGLQYNFTRNTFATLAYSLVETHVDGVIEMPERYKSAQYVVANVMWKLSPHVQMGVEYLWGDRENANGNSYDNNRAQSMIQVSF